MPPTAFFDLLNALESLKTDKFVSFQHINTNYKSPHTAPDKDSTSIGVDVLIPKEITESKQLAKRPVIVRIHGGFLVTGSSLYPPWFSDWILNYAESNGAIILSPNYRLLPEAAGQEILEDMNAFWSWFRAGSVEKLLQHAGLDHLVPDYDRVLVVGESAGGYLAVQLGLSYPRDIRAIIAAYPMLDLRARFYTEAFDKPIVGVSNLSNQVLDDHLKLSWGEGPVTAADPPDRLELAFSIVQNGRFLEFFGQNRDLFPLERVEDLVAVGPLKLPPTFIFHGEQDSAVPVEGSRRFVGLIRKMAPHVQIKLHVDNGDHGFDVDAGLDTPWLKDGLDMISNEWLTPHTVISNL